MARRDPTGGDRWSRPSHPGADLRPAVRTAAIILAAGRSSRMGIDKALLPLNGMPCVEWLVRVYRRASVGRLILVVGSNAGGIGRLGLGVELCTVDTPADDMLGSIQAAIPLLGSADEAFFIHPVDTPLVRPATLEALMRALASAPRAQAALPLHQGRRGHPPLLRASLAGRLLTSGGPGGLAGMLASVPAVGLACSDPGCRMGMNTPDEYRALCTCAEALARAGLAP